MKKGLFVFITIIGASLHFSVAYANYFPPGYQGNVNVGRLYVQHDGYAYFGVDGAVPNNTCERYGVRFRFNTNTEIGKHLLAVLVAAKAKNATIDIWYDHSAGDPCTDVEALAVARGIGFHD